MKKKRQLGGFPGLELNLGEDIMSWLAPVVDEEGMYSAYRDETRNFYHTGRGERMHGGGERGLLSAVLYRAIEDLDTSHFSDSNRSQEREQWRRHAILFFLSTEESSEDRLTFYQICTELDLHPDAILHRLRSSGLLPYTNLSTED